MKQNMKKCVVLFLILCCICYTCGCTADARQPEEVAEQMLCFIRDGKMEKARKLMYNPEDFTLGDESDFALNDALTAHLSWNFGEKRYDAENDYYMLEADITMVDISEVMGQIMTEYFDQMLQDAANGITWEDDTLDESIANELDALITAEDAPLVTKHILIYLVPDPDGDWLVFVQDDLINAVTGGVLEAYEFYSTQGE